jgi:DNA-binding Lrp family transcriptional regulator
MGGTTLALDTIVSAMFHSTTEWSQGLESNKARKVLRYVIYRLYAAGEGNLITAELQLAQATIAQRLEISKQWLCELTARLEREGWLEHFSPKLPDGMNGSTLWRAGRQLKRLVISLTKSAKKEADKRVAPQSKALNETRIFLPFFKGMKNFFYPPTKNEPLKPETITKIPLLERWLKRGETEKDQSSVRSVP